MALFPPNSVLREFPAAAYAQYASPQTLVRPSSTKKLLIFELDTPFVSKICEWALIGFILELSHLYSNAHHKHRERKE
jgi:hypothetical protein